MKNLLRLYISLFSLGFESNRGENSSEGTPFFLLRSLVSRRWLAGDGSDVVSCWLLGGGGGLVFVDSAAAGGGLVFVDSGAAGGGEDW